MVCCLRETLNFGVIADENAVVQLGEGNDFNIALAQEARRAMGQYVNTDAAAAHRDCEVGINVFIGEEAGRHQHMPISAKIMS